MATSNLEKDGNAQACPECSAEVPSGATECPGCGTALSIGEGGALAAPNDSFSKVDKIADDATQLIHDIVKVARGASRVGKQVTELTKSAAKGAKDSGESLTSDVKRPIAKAARKLKKAGHETASKVKAEARTAKTRLERETREKAGKAKTQLRTEGRKMKAKARMEGHKVKAGAQRVVRGTGRRAAAAERRVRSVAHRANARVRRATNR